MIDVKWTDKGSTEMVLRDLPGNLRTLSVVGPVVQLRMSSAMALRLASSIETAVRIDVTQRKIAAAEAALAAHKSEMESLSRSAERRLASALRAERWSLVYAIIGVAAFAGVGVFL